MAAGRRTSSSPAATNKATAPANEQPGPKPAATVGRHTKRTPETQAALEEAIGRFGMSDKLACDYARISHDTFYSWLREDPAFSEAIAQARARFVAYHCRIIIDSAERDARHSEWMLAHRFSQDYAEKQQIESTSDSSPLDKLFAPEPPEGAETADYKSPPPAPNIVNGQSD